MKNDPLYPLYISYLERRVHSDEFGDIISKNKLFLLKMSESYFVSFKDRFEEDELFHKKILKLQTSELRNKKIDDIFDDIN